MQTAEEFLQTKEPNTFTVPEEYLIEFAKLHVEAALRAAVDNVEIVVVKYTDDEVVSDESILNAYPLTNIK